MKRRSFLVLMLTIAWLGSPGLAADTDIRTAWATYAGKGQHQRPAARFPFQHCFERAAAAHEVPLGLLLAVARGESNFDPVARSSANAIGIMQIQWPQTGRHLGIRSERELYQPCTNVEAGARYLNELRNSYQGDLHLALAAYNYGPSRISDTRVPDGANWYSEYIYRHLQAVNGSSKRSGNAAESTAAELPVPSLPGRQLLISFNSPWRARFMLRWLEDQATGVRVDWFHAPLGRHQLVLLFDDENERLRSIDALTAAGLPVAGSGTISM